MPTVLDHAVAIATGDDPDRLQKRRVIKREIAECEVVKQRAALKQREIDNLNSRKDSASNRHEATTAPAQERLAAIDEEIAGCLLDRTPVPPALEDERRNLLTVVADANLELETEIAAIDKSLGRANRELRELQNGYAQLQVLQNKLADDTHGEPELKKQQFVLDQVCHWAHQRVRAAESQVAQWRDAVAALNKKRAGNQRIDHFGFVRSMPQQELDAHDAQQLRIFQQRLGRWEFELQHARAAMAEAQEAGEQIRAQLIDE